MPTPPVPSKSLLSSKVGRVPVWALAGGGLAAAWLWSKHNAAKNAANSSASSTASVPGAAEPSSSAPYFVVENNLPPTSGASPSAPVPPPTGQPPTSGPPSTSPSPPTNQPPSTQPPGTAPGTSGGSSPAHTIPGTTYRVQAGDTLTSIAKSHGLDAAALWAYQLDPKNNPASQIQVLRQRGPNRLFPGETIRIPPHS